MLVPSNTALCPRGGWSVTIEGAEPAIVSNHWMDFINQVSKRVRINGLDQHGWRERAIDLMCRQRPDIESHDEDIQLRDITGDDIRRFVRTMWEAVKAGATPVSGEEQERRAAICLDCPKRGYVNCMGGCGALAQALAEITIHGKTRDIPGLHKNSCMVCGCELSSLIMYPLDVIKAVDKKMDFTSGDYPDHCWKTTEQKK